MKAAVAVALAVAAALTTAPDKAHAQGSDACTALGNLRLPDTVALTAERVPAGPFTVATGSAGPGPQSLSAEVPAFCRVKGTVAPAIQFEVWLPEPRAWNGRFQAVGGGGFAGVISYGAMLPNINAGYVTASTDTGHVASDLEWLSDDQRMHDYGYRAIHEMTVKAKALTEAYYGRPADYNYFNGCSTGGRQGLMEAQRFPGDYDGIVSGAPVSPFIATHYTQLWVALAAKRDGDTVLDTATLGRVTKRVLEQCDAADGVTDGVLEDPRTCSFDPSVLQCDASGGSGECLSPAQADALRKIYAGPVNPRTGEQLHPGLLPGSEPYWVLVDGADLAPIPQEYFSRSVFADPHWDWRTFDFDEDIKTAVDKNGAILDATDPHLREFRDGGSKLIVYHGWNDQVIFPQGTIDYYEAVGDAVTAGAAPSDFFRLFMVPGMAHCRGGSGTDQFDAQAAIEAWVERGEAPARIEARRVENGTVTRSRPLCPYPQTARYDGRGDTNDASSFVCE